MLPGGGTADVAGDPRCPVRGPPPRVEPGLTAHSTRSTARRGPRRPCTRSTAPPRSARPSGRSPSIRRKRRARTPRSGASRGNTSSAPSRRADASIAAKAPGTRVTPGGIESRAFTAMSAARCASLISVSSAGCRIEAKSAVASVSRSAREIAEARRQARAGRRARATPMLRRSGIRAPREASRRRAPRLRYRLHLAHVADAAYPALHALGESGEQHRRVRTGASPAALRSSTGRSASARRRALGRAKDV